MVELVNRFLVYLRDAKKIKSEEKLRAYYEFAYQFYMDFIPLEYPELKQSIANMDPEIVEYFIRYWLIDNDLVYSPEELQTAGLALRHFFKFLVAEDNGVWIRIVSDVSFRGREFSVNQKDFGWKVGQRVSTVLKKENILKQIFFVI